MGTCQSRDLKGEEGVRTKVKRRIRHNDRSGKSIVSDRIVQDFASHSASDSIDSGGYSNNSFSTIESGERILLPIHQEKMIFFVQDLEEKRHMKKTKKNRKGSRDKDRQGNEEGNSESDEDDENDSSSASYCSEEENKYETGYLKNQRYGSLCKNEDRRLQNDGMPLEDWGSAATPKASNANNIINNITKKPDSDDDSDDDSDISFTPPDILLGSRPSSDKSEDDNTERDEELKHHTKENSVDMTLNVDTNMNHIDLPPLSLDTTKKAIKQFLDHDDDNNDGDNGNDDGNDCINEFHEQKKIQRPNSLHYSNIADTPETQPETPDNDGVNDMYSPQVSGFIYPAYEEESPIIYNGHSLEAQQQRYQPEECVELIDNKSSANKKDNDNKNLEDYDKEGEEDDGLECLSAKDDTRSEMEEAEDIEEEEQPSGKKHKTTRLLGNDACVINVTTTIPVKKTTSSNTITSSADEMTMSTKRQLFDSLKDAAYKPHKNQNQSQQLEIILAHTNMSTPPPRGLRKSTIGYDNGIIQTKTDFLNSLRQVADSPFSVNSEVERELPDTSPPLTPTTNTSVSYGQQSKSDFLNSLRSFMDSPRLPHQSNDTPTASATPAANHLMMVEPPSSTNSASNSSVEDKSISVTSTNDSFLVNVNNDASDVFERKKRELQKMRSMGGGEGGLEMRISDKIYQKNEVANITIESPPPHLSSIFKLGGRSLRAIEESTIASLPDVSFHHELGQDNVGEDYETVAIKSNSNISHQYRHVTSKLSADHDDQSSVSSLGSNSIMSTKSITLARAAAIGSFITTNSAAASTTATEHAIPPLYGSPLESTPQEFSCIMSGAIPKYHFDEVDNSDENFDPIIMANSGMIKFDGSGRPVHDKRKPRLSPSESYTSVSYRTPLKERTYNIDASSFDQPHPIQKLNPPKFDLNQRQRGGGDVTKTNKRMGRSFMARKQETTARLAMERNMKEQQSVDPNLIVKFDDLKVMVKLAEKEMKSKGVVERRVEQCQDIVRNERLFQDFQRIERNRKVRVESGFGDVEVRNKSGFDLKSADNWFVNFYQPSKRGNSDNSIEPENEACFSLLGANNNKSFNEKVMISKQRHYLSLQSASSLSGKPLEASLSIDNVAQRKNKMLSEGKGGKTKNMKNTLKNLGSSMRKKLGSSRRKDKKAAILDKEINYFIDNKSNEEKESSKTKIVSQEEQRFSSLNRKWEKTSLRNKNIKTNVKDDPNSRIDDNISYCDSQYSDSCDDGSKNDTDGGSLQDSEGNDDKYLGGSPKYAALS